MGRNGPEGWNPLGVIYFLDFEASSLDDGSYPIEAGWAALDLSTGEITSEAMLIAPVSYWTDWNPASQAIHGIERDVLVRDGYSVRAVAQRMNMVLSGHVLCDGGDYDGHWSQRLFAAAGYEPAFALASYWQAVRERMFDHGVAMAAQVMVYEKFRAPRPHRAEADARIIAELYRDCVTF